MLGPFDSKPFADIQCSPLDYVEKNVPGELRLIYHVSYPRNNSLNDGIPRLIFFGWRCHQSNQELWSWCLMLQNGYSICF